MRCLFILFFFVLFSGCNLSDPEPEQPAQKMAISPGAIEFSPKQVGATDQQRVMLQNKGGLALEITQIQLEENQEDNSPELSIVDAPDLPLVLAPGKSMTVNLQWAPLDDTPDTGVLRVLSNDPQNPEQQIALTTPETLKETGDIDLKSSPAQIVFDSAVLNKPTTVNLTLSIEDTTQSLTIEDAFLIENDEDNFSEVEFSVGATLPFSITQKTPLMLTLTYTPMNAKADTGILRLKTSNTSRPFIDVPFSVSNLMLTGVLAPAIVNMRNQPAGKLAIKEFVIRNNTMVDWPIDDIKLENNTNIFALRFFDPFENKFKNDPPANLPVDGSLRIEVRATSQSKGLYTTSVKIASSTEPMLLTVPINVNFTDVCLRLEEVTFIDALDYDAVLSFGLVSKGQTQTHHMILANCDLTNTVRLSDFTVMSETTSFETTLNNLDVDLAPFERLSVPITFSPDGSASEEGILTFKVNDSDYISPKIKLKGQAIASPCKAVTASLTNVNTQDTGVMLNATPLSTFELKVTSEHAPGTRFDWVIRERPIHARMQLVPGANDGEKTLFTPLVGIYTVDIHATSPDGVRGCAPATLQIIAEPKQSIYLQLHWHSTNDSNVFDDSGTDLDLHYSRGANWNNPADDIFFQNKTAEWGEMGIGDDPIMIRDDEDGYGPEAIGHDPDGTSGANHHIAAYYFANNGHGSAYGSIQVYVDGALRYDQWSTRLNTRAFWHIGVLEDGTKMFTEINTVQTGFPTPK